MNRISSYKAFAASVLLTLVWIAPAHAQQEQNYQITKVTGDLFRAANNTHRTVFLVTRDGIILADPINVEFSKWLKAELDERFDVPVRYVLYSHHHADHASGGAVFADTATFVAHENMPALAAGLENNADIQLPDQTF